MSDKKILPPALAPFVMQWGELGSAWGIGRSAARIHGLLLVSDRSLTADEIVAALAAKIDAGEAPDAVIKAWWRANHDAWSPWVAASKNWMKP